MGIRLSHPVRSGLGLATKVGKKETRAVRGSCSFDPPHKASLDLRVTRPACGP